MTPRRRALWLAAICAAVFLAYAPSLRNGFAMDDRLVAMGINDAGQPHPMVHELAPLGDYFRAPYWKGVDENDRLYRPLTILSFALRHHGFGDDPFPEHLLNLVLHLGAVLLVHAILRALGAGDVPALLGALVFGLHAIHSEVVATVVGRSELLAFDFGGLGLLAFLRARSAPRAPAMLWLAASAVCLFAAFCSKESALAWLPFLVVFEAAVLWRGGAPIAPRQLGGSLLRALLCGLPPLALFLALRAAMIAARPGAPEPILFLVNPIADAEATVRVLTAVVVQGFALLLTLFPFRLACDYGAMVLPVVTAATDLRFLAVATALLAVLAGGLVVRRRHPLLFLAVATFFGFLFITSNVPFPIGTIFGERLCYAPSLLCAFVVAWCFGRYGTPAAWFVLGLWLGASTLTILERNPVWRDDETLFLHEVQAQPRSVRMQTCAANVRANRGEAATAERHLRLATELDPENALAWNNLAATCLDAGRLDEAEQHVRRGLTSRHFSEREDLFKLHCNLGLVLARKGRLEEAAVAFGEGLARKPGFLRAWQELWQLRADGKLAAERLVAILAECERRSPNLPHWSAYRGLLAHSEGSFVQAEAALRQALAQLPRHELQGQLHAEARLMFADSLLQLGKRKEALEGFRQLEQDPFAPAAQRTEAARVLGQLR